MIDDNPLIFAPHSISAATFRRVLRTARSPAFVETDALLAALDEWGADRGIALRSLRRRAVTACAASQCVRATGAICGEASR